MVCDECASLQIRLMSLLRNRLSVQMFSLFLLLYFSICFSLLSSEQDYHECHMYLKNGMVSSLDDARLKKNTLSYFFSGFTERAVVLKKKS